MSDAIAFVLSLIAPLVVLNGFFPWRGTKKLMLRTGWGSSIDMLSGILLHATWYACLCAGFAAVSFALYDYLDGGNGRRRLKRRLRKLFRPVRRTAPQPT